MSLNYWDIVITIILLLAAWGGFKKGLIYEVATLIALVLGVYGALLFSDTAATYLGDTFGTNPEITPILAFCLVFLGIVVVVHLIGKLFTKAADLAALGFINKFSGALFAVLKRALILSVFIMLAGVFWKDALWNPSEPQARESVLLPHVVKLAPAALDFFSTSGWANDFNHQLDSLWQQREEQLIPEVTVQARPH